MPESPRNKLRQQIERIGLDAELKELLMESYSRLSDTEIELTAGVLEDSLNQLEEFVKQLKKFEDSDEIQ